MGEKREYSDEERIKFEWRTKDVRNKVKLNRNQLKTFNTLCISR